MTQKAIVIGGGVIGLSCAFYLRKKGLEVTVLEKDQFGNASSWGNQGWICPTLHEPVPAPGLVGDSLKWLMKKDSPLYIKPTAGPQLSGWLAQFMKYCNKRDFNYGKDALLTLSKSTLSLYDSLEREGLDMEIHRNGFLFTFFDNQQLQQSFDKFKSNWTNYGHDKPTMLTKEEVKKLEPNITNNITGGIFLNEQRHVRPDTVTAAFYDWLNSSGAELYSNTEVTNVEYEGNTIKAVQTNEGLIEADICVVTSGVWSGSLAKQLNYSLPLQAGKGYSITISNPNLTFNRPIYLGDSKAGISPFKDKVRIGGTMELSGINTNLDKKRVKNLRESVSKYLNENLYGETEVEWTGMRPMTPDGLPVIGKIPDFNNAFIATGHGMVGLSMAPVTGEIISELVCNGETEYDITAFLPERFS